MRFFAMAMYGVTLAKTEILYLLFYKCQRCDRQKSTFRQMLHLIVLQYRYNLF